MNRNILLFLFATGFTALLLLAGCGGGSGGDDLSLTLRGTVLGATTTTARTEGAIEGAEVCALGGCDETDSDGFFSFGADGSKFAGGAVLFTVAIDGTVSEIVVNDVTGGTAVVDLAFQVDGNGSVSGAVTATDSTDGDSGTSDDTPTDTPDDDTTTDTPTDDTPADDAGDTTTDTPADDSGSMDDAGTDDTTTDDTGMGDDTPTDDTGTGDDTGSDDTGAGDDTGSGDTGAGGDTGGSDDTGAGGDSTGDGSGLSAACLDCIFQVSTQGGVDEATAQVVCTDGFPPLVPANLCP